MKWLEWELSVMKNNEDKTKGQEMIMKRTVALIGLMIYGRNYIQYNPRERDRERKHKMIS